MPYISAKVYQEGGVHEDQAAHFSGRWSPLHPPRFVVLVRLQVAERELLELLVDGVPSNSVWPSRLTLCHPSFGFFLWYISSRCCSFFSCRFLRFPAPSKKEMMSDEIYSGRSSNYWYIDLRHAVNVILLRVCLMKEILSQREEAKAARQARALVSKRFSNL